MTRAEIAAGICGFVTRVEAQMVGAHCALHIDTECSHVGQMARELRHLDPLREITYRGEGPLALEVAARWCRHPACPVPVGILKAVEVEAGLALPSDVTITLTRSEATG